ncbi:large lipid transfer protein-like [Tropilaelaps mercedesae]|uniref:Large lipid transfer protein-like n=1 Tax=Tropilaelaps mercedesae TaxID=418985 RepID=A0A1V9XCZ0_9ACAR|nr:large lipid transfer protein-like [Tropilaelaps mercedesae]
MFGGRHGDTAGIARPLATTRGLGREVWAERFGPGGWVRELGQGFESNDAEHLCQLAKGPAIGRGDAHSIDNPRYFVEAADQMGRGAKENREHHLDAMRGLLMIAPAHTAAVRKVSAEIYFDHTKPSDIRMLASVALFAKTAAPFNLLQGLIDDLKHEPSDQVKMFVVSIIKEIDKKSDHPCFKPIAQHIRYLAPKVAALFPSEWKRKDFLTSYFMLSSGYDATYDYGGHSMFAVLMSDSYLPSVMHIAFGDYMANYFFESFGLTIRQQGMERVIDHMMSPKRFGTAFGHSLWNFGGRRRLARNAADVSTLEQTIEEKLKIAPKRYDPMRFEMQINAFGHDIDILSLNESHFMPLISPKYTPGMLIDNLLKTDRDLHHFHNMRDMTFMVPTEFGLPAWLDIQMPTVISYTRKSSSFDMTKEGAIKMKLDHRLVIDSRLTENFGFGIPLMHVALGMGFSKRVGVNLPLNVDMDANLATGKVSFNKDFRLPHDLINYHFNPYSFKHYLNEPEKSMELALFKDQEVKQFKQEILGDILGVNFHVDGYRLPDEALSQDLTDWLYKFDWRQKLYYWITNPKWHPRKLRLSAQPAETNPSTGRVFTVKHKMTPPEATERPASTFKEFQTDLPESFVHVWHVTDTFKGTKERRAEIEFRYSYTPDRTKHWFQLFYDRTPFSSKEKDHVKVCLISKAKQTTTDWEKVHNDKIQHVNDDQKVEVDTTLHYGKNCKSGAEVVTHVEYSHSDQQKQWLHELETGVTQTQVHGLDNPFMKHFKGCTKGLKKGLMFPYSCHKFIIHSSQLNKMTMDVKFNEHVRLHENPVLTTLYSIMRSAYYPHLRLDFMRPNGTTPGEIHVKSVVRTPCIDQRVADIEFMGPRHTSIWKSVPVSWGAHWAPKTATHLGMTNMQSYSRKWYHRYCDIQHNSVATFDNVMYEIPETTCWKVLAKDCSEHKIFTILSRNTENKKKDVRVLMDMHIFDISHVGDAIMLKMDGVEQKLVDDKPKVVMNERGVLTHILTTINRTLATIETPVYGLSVVAVDSSVFVQVAPFYRGKLCGLCGDFNLDRQHEFLTTDGRRHNTAWSYASNFVVPDDMCTIPPDTGASTPVVTHY